MGITASSEPSDLLKELNTLGSSYSPYGQSIVDNSLDGNTLLSLSSKEEIEEILKLSGVSNLVHLKILTSKVFKAIEDNLANPSAPLSPLANFSSSVPPAIGPLGRNSPFPRIGSSQMQPGAPPAVFICPLSQVIMIDPVVTADGTSYERQHIEAYLKTHASGPSSPGPLPFKVVFPNTALRAIIHKWCIDRGMGAGQDGLLAMDAGPTLGMHVPAPGPFVAPSDYAYPSAQSVQGINGVNSVSSAHPGHPHGHSGHPPFFAQQRHTEASLFDDDDGFNSTAASSQLMSLGEWDPTPIIGSVQSTHSSPHQRNAPPRLASHITHILSHQSSFRSDDGSLSSSLSSTPRSLSAAHASASSGHAHSSRGHPGHHPGHLGHAGAHSPAQMMPGGGAGAGAGSARAATSDSAGKLLKDCFSKVI